MDFFASQQKAINNSRYLYFLYFVCIILVVLGVYTVVFTTVKYFFGENSHFGKDLKDLSFFDISFFLKTSLFTLVIIIGSFLYKYVELGEGGEKIALSLGGRKVDPSTTNFKEKQLINVVEEMAIASGVPVPDVYILDKESSINAFAAGNSVSNAVIGITKGALNSFNRSELQGVIAHEFSHILNGDMLINMRLIALIFSLMVIWIIGKVMLRVVFHSSRSRVYVRSNNSRNKGNGTLVLLVFGLGICLVGMLGYFASFILKNAISRQREYLADASAVQFTRNPNSISSALKKIGGFSGEKALLASSSELFSHLFFSIGTSSFMNLFSTHPPLEERIKAIEPSWDGNFIKKGKKSLNKKLKKYEQSFTKDNLVSSFSSSEMSQNEVTHLEKNSDSKLVGVHPHLVIGTNILKKFSKKFIDKLHDEDEVKLVIYSLLLSQDGVSKENEFKYIKKYLSKDELLNVVDFSEELEGLSSYKKIAIVDISIPTLRKQTSEDYLNFRRILSGLIESDGKINLFEFTLQKIIKRHLDLYFFPVNKKVIFYRSIEPLKPELAVILSTLAGVGKSNRSDIETSFKAGLDILSNLGLHLNILPPENCSINEIDKALDKFYDSSPSIKKLILKMCERVVEADGILQDEEAELLRAIADTMHCPIPPILYKD